MVSSPSDKLPTNQSKDPALPGGALYPDSAGIARLDDPNTFCNHRRPKTRSIAILWNHGTVLRI